MTVAVIFIKIYNSKSKPVDNTLAIARKHADINADEGSN